MTRPEASLSGRLIERRRRRGPAGLLLLAAIIGLWATPATAHTALLEASPGPDQTAGGTIEGIDLAFLDPVTNAIVTVSYNGEAIAGTTTISDGELVRFEFERPLDLDGRYQVDYEMISFDSDFTTSGFFFTYTADAPEPARLSAPGSEGTSQTVLLASIAGITVLMCALAVFIWNLEGKRRKERFAVEADDDW